ncbi:MAG: uroporphyrinogen decarboxylase family protein [Candidatus Latescibacter sp.]|nr:uroporphyrinogen decarboxylase family protein [Candidatus Latescibacter sp.]
MTSKDRFYRTLHYQPVDHVPDIEFGYWEEIQSLWEEQGLPKGLTSKRALEYYFGNPGSNHHLAIFGGRALDMYFGLEQRTRLTVDFRMRPVFEKENLYVRNGYQYFYDVDRVLSRIPDDGLTTMPEHLEYSLKNRRDWETIFKPRLNPDKPGRVPENLSEITDRLLAHDEFPYIYAGSLFGHLRNFVGFEQICYMIYDDPELVDEMIQHMADLSCSVLERALPLIRGKIFHAHYWEDICFNNGPMISPAWFREHLVPRYKQINTLLHAYGVDVISVDCDGWIGPLVEDWLEAGVNGMFPSEVRAGSDPVKFRKQYGRDLLLMGGVDKTKIAMGGDALVCELERLAPVVREGGFIPFCDHYIPADVTLDKFRFYLQKKREIFGIPLREEKERDFPDEI